MTFDCSCSYEPADYYDPRRHTARKHYCCDECAGDIAPGERYERAYMRYDGDGSTFLTCAGCLALRDWVVANIPCFCWPHGDMLEAARDTVYEAAAYAPEETVGLRFGFLRRKLIRDRRTAERRGARKSRLGHAGVVPPGGV